MSYLDLLKEQFNANVSLREKRPGIQQIVAPLYHEDGDMVDIFLETPEPPNGSRSVRICDHGMTLMRLSYSFELDTENKLKIFNRILAANGILNDNGNLFLDVAAENLNSGVLHFAQSMAKVSSLELLKREIASSLFFEMVTEFVQKNLKSYNPQDHVFPIPDREDLEVDFSFQVKPSPIYVFAVNNNARARLATISCLEFQKAGLQYRSFVVHDDFDALSAKDRKRVTSAADKQFVSLKDFRDNAGPVLKREVVA